MDRDLDLRRETVQSQVTTVPSRIVRALLLLSPGAPDLGLIDRLVERAPRSISTGSRCDAKGTVRAATLRGLRDLACIRPLIAGAMTARTARR
jgi:hypothetical protein